MKVVIDGVEYVPKLTLKSNEVPKLHKIFGEARARIGMPLRKVAELIGMSTNTVHCAEAGGTITLLTAAKLSALYGIDMNDIARAVIAHTQEKSK